MALHIQLLQYLLLVILGTHEVEGREVEQRRFPIGAQRSLQPLVAHARNKVLERVVAPISLKRVAHLLNDLWQLKLRGFEVPFLAILQGVTREVAGADIGGMEARVAKEDIRLGMQAVLRAVVGYLNLRVGQRGQSGYGVVVGCACVGGGNDTEAFALACEFSQTIPKQVQSTRLDERHHPAYLVGTEYLAVQLALHIGRPSPTKEQGTTAERGDGCDGFQVSLNVGILAIGAIDHSREDALLRINQVELRIVHPKFTAQGLDHRIDEVGIGLGTVVLGSANESHFDKML